MGRHRSYRSYDSSEIIAYFVVFGGMFLLILIIAVVPAVIKVSNQQTYVVTVTEKGRVSDKSKYLVYTFDENKESRVFEVTDSLFKWRFDSADVYNRIEVGKTYKVTTGGFRVPILSMYPNIYEYEIVEDTDNNSGESDAAKS